GIAAAILVHELLQTIQPLLRVDVVRVDGACHDRIAEDFVMLQRFVDLLPAALDLRTGYDDAFGLPIVDVLARRLRSKTAFRERAGREGMRRAADGIAGAEQTFD